MSEELENSLQQAVETYLNDRLQTIDEQLARLQAQVTDAVSQLRESSRSQHLEGTTLSAAIFAHLQTARGQKLSGPGIGASPAKDAGAIKRAIEDLQRQHSQSEVLSSLLRQAVQFAERAALFVVKNDQAIGWRMCEASDGTNLEMIGGVSLPLTANTCVTRAVNARAAWSGEALSSNEDHLLVDQLGGEPKIVSVVPLIVRGKTVAVLYADSLSTDLSAINSDALEALALVAAMSVNLVSVSRSAEAASKPEAKEAGPAEAATVSTTTSEVSEAPVEPEPTYTPVVEAPPVEEPQREEATAPVEVAAPEVAQAPAVETSMEAPAEEPSAAEMVSAEESQPVYEASATDIAVQTAVTEPLPAISEAQVEEPQIEAAQPSEPAPAAPIFASQYSTPLGNSRRYGVNEPDLPIEVGEEERRLHNDARRFARLLVSEIKLYNEAKVREGRSNSDLYTRLREDIDRSRQMYEKRVAPPVAARHDYFHQELVNTLAEGDPAKLGHGYPGAAVNA